MYIRSKETLSELCVYDGNLEQSQRHLQGLIGYLIDTCATPEAENDSHVQSATTVKIFHKTLLTYLITKDAAIKFAQNNLRTMEVMAKLGALADAGADFHVVIYSRRSGVQKVHTLYRHGTSLSRNGHHSHWTDKWSISMEDLMHFKTLLVGMY